MSQLFLLELPEAPPFPEEPPLEVEEPVAVPQILIPEVERLARIAAAIRRRRTQRVPDRSRYLPGDHGDPPRRNGVIQPRRFSTLSMVKAVPGIVGQFFDSAVPEEMWSLDADLAGPIIVVACPCGEEVEIPDTELEICDCGRCYWNVGNRVLVGNQLYDAEHDAQPV